ncbi:MAG TPA: phage tail sheath C-terminal domain-containing protein [Patescibacteria group bacterium]|nr:phage tail sheath C-terminal domain-containing protein [Patescibacteria group bacterium]
MFKTPGVYVQEVSTLPPSVAEVATAIPAFIGYTERGAAAAVEIEQISTLLEYEQRFGKPRPTAFTVDAAGAVKPLASNIPETQLWYALSLYFKNGGGRCYVVSVASHQAAPTAAGFEAGLAALEAEDEPTILVMPEATALAQDDFNQVCKGALQHCQKLGDRFAILDVKGGDVGKFRDGIGTDHLAYGAAYYPYLDTSLPHVYDEAGVKLGDDDGAPTLASLRTSDTARYNDIKKQLAGQRVTLPPSAAIAGAYARVDRERGVWKAPANVSLAQVIGPATQVTFDQQEQLNVDPTSGKSINAIRAFSGKGTLIWGARTLAGNDNEWRYVNVRRLFLMVEESAKKASAFAVFEANDASTWLKVKGMLESYLYGLWEQGALQGARPEDAFYVNVGLGKTMTAQDVLEGRMIVQLGLAAVRPAEFIVLRFSHKLPEA